ncbi:MAG: hypothetical protein AAFO86_05140 [Pseudomonadota bacterium]
MRTDIVERGDSVTIDRHADLVMVLTGGVHVVWRDGFATDLTGPALVLSADVHAAETVVTRRLRLISMTHASCAVLLARHRAFRDLFFEALSRRIQGLLPLRDRPRRILH